MTDRFLPYEEAKAFVHSLNFKGFKEWEQYRKSEKRPHNIPSHPNILYKNTGWISWYDWIGTSVKTFLPYEEAKALAHTLNFKSREEWRDYCKSGMKPINIPTNPEKYYKNKGWVNWYDWLGEGLARSSRKSKSKHLKKLTALRRKFVKASNALEKIKLEDVNWLSKTGLLMDIMTSFMMDIYKLFPVGDDRKEIVHQFLEIQDDIDMLIYRHPVSMFGSNPVDVLFHIAVLLGNCLGIIETRIEEEKEKESHDPDNIPF